MLSTMALDSVGGHVNIYTFPEGIRWIKEQMAMFAGAPDFNLTYIPVDPKKEEVVFENSYLTVRTIPLRHRVPCVGYVFEEKEKLRHINKEMCDFHRVPVSFMKDLQRGADFTRDDGVVIPNAWLTTAPSPSASYAHIGDTAYMPEIAERIGPVDLLYHETTYTSAFEKEARERYHSTAAQAAMMARACGAKRLLAGHYSSRFKDETPILQEAAAIFPDTILASERLRLPL